MNKTPVISIIVPVFNMEKYLSQCIESILGQSYTDYELILIDDGSVDKSLEICNEYAKADDRIRVIHKENAGVSSARNDGIKCACGEYITFVDSDDMLPQDSLSNYLLHAKKSKSDVVVGNYIQEYDGKKVQRKARLAPGEYVYKDIEDKIIDDGTLTGFLFGSACTCFYRRDVIIKNSLFFDERVKVNEDGLFNFKFMSICNKICVIDEYVYIYRQWKTTTQKLDNIESDKRFDICEQVLNEFLENKKDVFSLQLQRRRVSIVFWNAIRIQAYKCNYTMSKKYLGTLLSDKSLSECFGALDYANMNIFKKVLCCFLKKNNLLFFYISVKYFVPVMQKVVKR